MATNPEEILKNWSKLLTADDASKLCPLLSTEDNMVQFPFKDSNQPLSEKFKLPVPWHKKEGVQQSYDRVSCEIKQVPQVKTIETKCSCQCKKVTFSKEEASASIFGQSSVPLHEPSKCAQTLTKPVLLQNHDNTVCTCPKVPLPLIKAEPPKPSSVKCECNAAMMKPKATTPFQCLKDKREMNISQLLGRRKQEELDKEKETLILNEEKDRKLRSGKRKDIAASTSKESNAAKTEISSGVASDKTKTTARTEATKTGGSGSKRVRCTDPIESSSTGTSFPAASTKTVFRERSEQCPCCKQMIKVKESETEDESARVKKGGGKIAEPRIADDKTKRLARTDISRSAEASSVTQYNIKKDDKTFNSSSPEESGDKRQVIEKGSKKPAAKKGKTENTKKPEKKGGKRGKKDTDDTFDEIKLDSPEAMKKIKGVVDKEKEDCKSRLKLAFIDGMYPGHHIGHKTCCLPPLPTPANMGWHWNLSEGAGKIKPDLGWKPGAIRQEVATLMAINRRGGVEEDIPKKEPEPEVKEPAEDHDALGVSFDTEVFFKREDDPYHSPSEEPKPTLHVHKSKGQYFISMCPPGKGNTDERNVLFSFDQKGVDLQSVSSSSCDESSTVTEDSMEMEFTSAYGMFKRRPPVRTSTVQTGIREKY